MSRSSARKAPPPPPARRAAPRLRQGARRHAVRNASASEMVGAVRARARRYAPRQTNPLDKENLADAAAAIAGGIGTAVAGGYLADKFDPRVSNSITAGVAGTASLFTEKGGWRTFLQSVASASAGQAALAILADADPRPAPTLKEPAKIAASTSAAPAAKPAQAPPAAGKRNAMPSAAMDRAFARSEARIAQVLADDGYDA
jgi:hypothetical protein